jgi:hypothetical protein
MAFVALNISIMASNTFKYSLPIIEGNPEEEITHNPSLPRFISFIFPEYTFSPNSVNDVGVTTIKGELRSN